MSVLVLCMVSCTEDQIDADAELDLQLEKAVASYAPSLDKDFYILPQSNKLASIPQDPKNRLSNPKVELGKFLFFETGLALDAAKDNGMGTYSCASCHIPEAGFRPGNVQGIGDGGMGFGVNGEGRFMNTEYQESELDVQAARPLSLVNVAYVKNTFWNGQFGSTLANVGTEHLWSNSHATERNHLGYEGIETQNMEGVDAHRMVITKELMDEYGYTELFDDAFPQFKEEYRYTRFTGAMAISAYIRTILSYEAPFQKWLQGETSAMSTQEKEGALLFFGKAGCNKCHYEKNLGSSEFHALGVKDMDQNPMSVNKNPDDRRNLGRGGFVEDPEWMYKFKVPGIYNMSDTPFYFHGSSKESLREVVEYKLNAEKENDRVPQSQMSHKLEKISLTDIEIDNLVAFLEKGLRDPGLVRYKPDYVKSGLCYPNNDYISQEELDCN